MKIKGIELKAVKEFVGMEGYGFSANVYMDGKKIGTAMDDACGGGSYASIDKAFYEEFKNRVHEYVSSLKGTDTLAVYQMSPEEYKKHRAEGTLPTGKSILPEEEQFLEALLEANRIEKEVKKGLKKGFKAFVEVEFISLHGTPSPRDIAYFTDGSKEQLNQIEAVAEARSVDAKGCPYEIHVYTEDFLKEV